MHDISIIIPAYCTTPESVSWLGECIESAKMQDCEVVVYNDGSPISLHDLRKQAHIFVDGSVNIGVSHARNRAAYYATCGLLYPLDGDDRLAPNAIDKLLKYWDGMTPVYSDVAKFGAETDAHYQLLDFNCDHILKHVGFSSVNVLHPKKYWEQLGGWDEWLIFYEDGYYNARLFAQWCGVRCPEPLVEYRQHDNQRTKQFKSQSATFAKIVADKIRRLDMACGGCSKSKMVRTTGSAPVMQPAATDVNTLPGEQDGRILSQYIGGQGKARHYYKGPGTKFMYKVKYGDYVYADPMDVKQPGDTHPAHADWLLVQIIKPAPKAVPVQESVTSQTPALPEVQPQKVVETVEEKPKAPSRNPVKNKAKKPK